MTRLPRPTLRALRSVVARALGVRRSRVRIVDRVYPHLGRVTDRDAAAWLNWTVPRVTLPGVGPGSFDANGSPVDAA